MEKTDVILDVSARHIHLRPEDVAVLFGSVEALTLRKNHINALSDNGAEVFNERVEIVGPKGSIKNVTILGPFRNYSQVEISKTDARTLGVESVVRMSGKPEGTPGIDIVGPKGTVKLERGCVVAKRHVHMNDSTAAELGLKGGDVISVEVKGTDRSLIFNEVIVKASAVPRTVMHLDTDEANAGSVKSGMIGTIIV